MPICPGCESRDVRPSRHRHAFDFIYRWRGMRTYRCNECRRSFYAPPPIDPSAKRVRRSAKRKLWRWGLEFLLFLVLVVAFYSIIQFAWAR